MINWIKSFWSSKEPPSTPLKRDLANELLVGIEECKKLNKFSLKEKLMLSKIKLGIKKLSKSGLKQALKEVDREWQRR